MRGGKFRMTHEEIATELLAGLMGVVQSPYPSRLHASMEAVVTEPHYPGLHYYYVDLPVIEICVTRLQAVGLIAYVGGTQPGCQPNPHPELFPLPFLHLALPYMAGNNWPSQNNYYLVLSQGYVIKWEPRGVCTTRRFTNGSSQTRQSQHQIPRPRR
jgi:hypothetical protein